MNQDYRPKYDQMQNNQPGKPEAMNTDRLYPNAGYNRKVGFILPNGDYEALNYAYLVKIRYVLHESAIYLTFTNCMVKIEGYRLKGLYLELMDDRNRLIECADERYAQSSEYPIVTNITVLENK